MSSLSKIFARKGSKSSISEEDNIFTDEVPELNNEHCGWLTKKATLKSKPVWCVLNGKWFCWWKDPLEQRNAERTCNNNHVDMSIVHQVLPSMNSKHANRFDIVTAKERLTYEAESKQECDEWISKLQMAMTYNVRLQSFRLSSQSSLFENDSTSKPALESNSQSSVPTISDDKLLESTALSTSVPQQALSFVSDDQSRTRSAMENLPDRPNDAIVSRPLPENLQDLQPAALSGNVRVKEILDEEPPQAIKKAPARRTGSVRQTFRPIPVVIEEASEQAAESGDKDSGEQNNEKEENINQRSMEGVKALTLGVESETRAVKKLRELLGLQKTPHQDLSGGAFTYVQPGFHIQKLRSYLFTL